MRSIPRINRVVAMWMASLALAACGPKYPYCEKDDDCREAEHCVNGRCQQCREDGDCAADEKCAAGACVPMDYCDSSDDCAEGQVCRDNRCALCLEDGECRDGMICITGVCRTPECTTDEECPAGLSCVDRRCKETESSAVSASEGIDEACEVESVYFPFDSSLLKPEARRTLQDDYNCIKSRGVDGRIVLEGHADPRGTTEYNMALGERRSRSVKRYLTRNGADPERYRVRSKGEEEASGYNERTWAKDRRVDFE